MEMFVPVRLRFLDVGHKHLDVTVAAEPAFARHLDDVLDGRVAEEDFGEGQIGSAELGKDGQDAGGFVRDALHTDDAAVWVELVLYCDFSAGFELFMEPGWHAFFKGVGAKLGFLGGWLAVVL